MLRAFLKAGGLALCLLVLLAGCASQVSQSTETEAADYSSVQVTAEDGYEIANASTILKDGQTIGEVRRYTIPTTVTVEKGEDGKVANAADILAALEIYDFVEPPLPYEVTADTPADWRFTFGNEGPEEVYYYFLDGGEVLEFAFSEAGQEMEEPLAAFIRSL